MTATYCMILTTTDQPGEAEKLAKQLVQKQLAACVQVFPITSTYRWEDGLVTEPEWMLIIKTRSELYQKIEEFLLEKHSYETPEILQIPISQGSENYLAWLKTNTLPG